VIERSLDFCAGADNIKHEDLNSDDGTGVVLAKEV
jgi:hypothetical protein